MGLAPISMYRSIYSVILLFFIQFSGTVSANSESIVDHHDELFVDNQLSLAEVIDLTYQNHPENIIIKSRKDEALALSEQSNQWFADAPRLNIRYEDDLPTDDIGSREFETSLELPLWNWGQKSQLKNLAAQSDQSMQWIKSALKLKIAGQIRNALWDIRKKELRYQHAQTISQISKTLREKIKRRVELGDLAHTDLLLASSHQLAKETALIKAEAELMHSRQDYLSLTQIDKMPAQFIEGKSPIEIINDSHPELTLINALINRKKAEMNLVESEGSGQSSVSIGGKSEKGGENEDDIERLSLEISIPFGGSAHLQPKIAKKNIELSELMALRLKTHRHLQKKLHEASHDLKVINAELAIADRLKQIAEKHLGISRLSFSAGEINLIDLLTIQARTFDSILYADEHQLEYYKKTAFYNQAVGVTP